MRSCLEAIQAHGGSASRVAWASLKFQVLVSILHVDDAKRVEGPVIEAAAYLYAGSSLDFGTAEAKG